MKVELVQQRKKMERERQKTNDIKKEDIYVVMGKEKVKYG
jgi:NACalpha-BTF3-like transcription factor